MATALAPRTQKFARRRIEILETACEHINIHGVRGMTLTAVARELGLDTSSVTYYFKKKDVLAAACIERTLLWQIDTARTAATEPDERARVRRFLHEHFELHRRQREPCARDLALLSDMSSLDASARAPLDAIYADILRIVRDFFDPAVDDAGRARLVLATTLLLNVIHWIPAWQDRYMTDDLARVEARLFDILDRGLQADGAAWAFRSDPLEQSGEGDAQSRFLHAATNLINRQGYIGASVERIAGELGVSTGSFYHHIDNKDDLVLACFDRSFDLVGKASHLADNSGGSAGQVLARMIASLVRLQLEGSSPLLRNSAYQALPQELRSQMLARTGQATRHVAGLVSDGIADGSLRAVDPVISSHVVMAMINGATDLRRWTAEYPAEQIGSAYLRMLQFGLLVR
jgi:AcrR family transcriptional regulator